MEGFICKGAYCTVATMHKGRVHRRILPALGVLAVGILAAMLGEECLVRVLAVLRSGACCKYWSHTGKGER